ncbi:MAG: hypothetical protein AB1465_03375 [Patescibacteria group bacterium]
MLFLILSVISGFIFIISLFSTDKPSDEKFYILVTPVIIFHVLLIVKAFGGNMPSNFTDDP